MGISGVGKSTSADLLLGLLMPDKGEIMVDNRSLTDIGLNNWRNAIAYMPQEFFLLHDSIRNNLLWSNPKASEEECWAALEMAQVQNYVSTLEKGIDTIVGDRGTQLSGGQRQRIALAMALIRKPSVLILDEFTNELDVETERQVYHTLNKLKEQKITIIIISHNPESLKIADHKWKMENGQYYAF